MDPSRKVRPPNKGHQYRERYLREVLKPCKVLWEDGAVDSAWMWGWVGDDITVGATWKCDRPAVELAVGVVGSGVTAYAPDFPQQAPDV